MFILYATFRGHERGKNMKYYDVAQAPFITSVYPKGTRNTSLCAGIYIIEKLGKKIVKNILHFSPLYYIITLALQKLQKNMRF